MGRIVLLGNQTNPYAYMNITSKFKDDNITVIGIYLFIGKEDERNNLMKRGDSEDLIDKRISEENEEFSTFEETLFWTNLGGNNGIAFLFKEYNKNENEFLQSATNKFVLTMLSHYPTLESTKKICRLVKVDENLENLDKPSKDNVKIENSSDGTKYEKLTNENPLQRRSWEEFRDTGLLWLVNTILHVFGWAITFSGEKDESGVFRVKEVFPSRVSYRGFDSTSNDRGYLAISKYLHENANTIYEETDESINGSN